jgi:pimeloyl-ACP methyl ester carboxylesterase
MSEFQDHITDGFGWRERPGDGPTVVALHGIGSEARGFDALAENLTGWRVIVWEAPGYGSSVPLTTEWPAAADYAEALDRFVDSAGLAKFHLVGHSLGTLIGAAFAVDHASKVLSLTLASCAQGGGVHQGAELPRAHAMRLIDLEREGAERFAKTRAPRLVHNPKQNPELVEAVARSMGKVKMPGYGQAVRMLAAGDLASGCARLRTRTAVVVGAEDTVTEPSQSIRAYEAIPPSYRGPVTVIPEAGHAIPLQAPKALADAIKSHTGSARAPKETAL